MAKTQVYYNWPLETAAQIKQRICWASRNLRHASKREARSLRAHIRDCKAALARIA